MADSKSPSCRVVCLWTCLLLAAASAPSHAAAQPSCAQGQGGACSTSNDCEENEDATVCISGTPSRCEIPCDDGFGRPDPSACSLGETCVEGSTPGVGGGTRYYCQASRFAIDLNMLDACILHFVESVPPDLAGDDTCSILDRLNAMLDQDSNDIFDIYDVDLCIRSFLGEEPCDPDTSTCPDLQVFCEADAECGAGLFCDQALHRCSRECGLVTNRAGSNLIDTLDRECAGSLKVCDYDSGRCNASPLDGATCQVDRDCPNGAYCLLGECQPKCFRSIDCPGSDWYCSTTNTCLPRPRDPDEEEPFDPQQYSVLLAKGSFTLDTVNDDYDLPLVIVNRISKKQVFDNPNVVFGYRLEVKYQLKQDDKCLRDLNELEEEDQRDCIIAADEEWITLENPFGTVFATGDPTLGVHLNRAATDRLSPGYYRATITAIFNNGSRSSSTVDFKKPSPNGDYFGRVSVYVDGPQNLLAGSNMTMKLFIDQAAPRVEWDTLLDQNNIVQDREIIDVTRGYRVRGFIHGNDSTIFNRPSAATRDQNEIPIIGLYSDQLRRMRLIAIVDLETSFCRSENGVCHTDVPNELQVTNIFGRKVRRIIELIGPYNETSFRFEGVYRETISGIAPHDVTLDGGFILNQSRQDDTPIQLGPLLTPAQSTAVGFPTEAQLLSRVNTVIGSSCAPADSARFATRAAFDAYLDQYDIGGPVLGQLVTFENLVAGALEQLGNRAETVVTLRDFFKGRITFCESPTDVNCVSESSLRCGLALHRKALLSGWVDQRSIGTDQTNTNLFCQVRAGQDPTCPSTAAAEPALVALQEHNRFYKELFQAQVYQAGEGLSDAFYTLYKAQNGDRLDASSAYQHKEINLREALDLYNQAARDLFAAESAAVLFNWPMRSFATIGDVWLQQMHAMANDRMDTLINLVDFRRRVLKSPSQQDFLFAKHVLHQEYLLQAFIATLQKNWQGELMQYAGEGPTMLDKGTDLLAKADETRNPLGLHPNRIYFENANPNVSNWQNFRDRIEDRLPEVERKIEDAITNMKDALRDEDSFTQSLLLDRQDIEATLDDFCGSDEPLPPACDVPFEDKQLETACEGSECLLEYECDGPECAEVATVFKDTLADEEVACRSDTRLYKIDGPGGPRPCVRGRVGALLQERVSLQLQRRQVVRRVQSLIRQIAREQQLIRETQSDNEDLIEYLEDQNVALTVSEGLIAAANAVFDVVQVSAESADCLIIVGLAAGTNCPQKIAAGIALGAAAGVKNAAVGAANVAISSVLRGKEIHLTEAGQNAQLRQQRMALDNLVTDVENLASEYQAVTQQLFNIDVRVQDALFLAQRSADRNTEKVAFLVDHLVGRNRGDILVRNRLIDDADREFNKLLLDTYKMTLAFIHRYNLNQQAEQWQNRVYQLVTVRDIRDFLSFLTQEEQNYCGGEGLDCDFINNREVFTFSMQKQLFPKLRDIVDPNTGSVLTVGQQFHNIITSSDFVKTRDRSYGISEQVEVPFAIWLNDRGEAGGAPQRYMVGPGDCNHIITGPAGGGTIAVNVIGTRIPRNPGVTFELWRGNTDYVRSCTDRVSPIESKINTYIVGWSPNNAFGQLSNPPSFVSLSGELPACINNFQLNNPATVNSQEGCFHYFGRDRSLGAPDWRLVIPRVDDDQQWLFGEGLPEHQQPVIEDIIVYVRYNDRPIAPQN